MAVSFWRRRIYAEFANFVTALHRLMEINPPLWGGKTKKRLCR
jgi:hypothetical protein